jgi:hypothetical protein
MSQWQELAKELSEWLRKVVLGQLSFRGPNRAIIGFPSDGFKCDGMVTDGKTLIAIEVEAGQMHPDTNVGKYWLLNNQFRAYRKIILFHIYTPEFNSNEWCKKLANFYCDKMKAEMPFDYVVLDYRQAVDYVATVSAIKELVKTHLKNEFGNQSCRE